MTTDSRVRGTAYAAVLLTGAIAGFFYAWLCSAMWGLDQADPRVAIAAMQAMNSEVRNPVFFPAFFLTPVALAVASYAARATGRPRAGVLFFVAAAVYLVGGLLLTMLASLPLNDELAAVAVPDSIDEAELIWSRYSVPWQRWNLARTVASFVALALALAAVRRLGEPAARGAGRVISRPGSRAAEPAPTSIQGSGASERP